MPHLGKNTNDITFFCPSAQVYGGNKEPAYKNTFS